LNVESLGHLKKLDLHYSKCYIIHYQRVDPGLFSGVGAPFQRRSALYHSTHEIQRKIYKNTRTSGWVLYHSLVSDHAIRERLACLSLMAVKINQLPFVMMYIYVSSDSVATNCVRSGVT